MGVIVDGMRITKTHLKALRSFTYCVLSKKQRIQLPSCSDGVLIMRRERECQHVGNENLTTHYPTR